MKATLLTACAALFISSAAVSCVSSASDALSKIASFNTKVEKAGAMVTRVIPVSEITAITSAQRLVVKYRQDSVTSVTLTAPDNIIDDVEIEDNDGSLDCGMKNNRRVDQPITVTVTAPCVSVFKASSGSSLTVDSVLDVSGKYLEISSSSGASFSARRITASDVKAESSSGSSVYADYLLADMIGCHSSSGASMGIDGITAKSVEASASSGASVQLSGNTGSVSLKASSGGSVSAAGLIAAEGSLKASSGGSVRGYVKGACDISKSSGGSASNRAEH